MFALPDEDAAEAAATSATQRMSAIQFGAVWNKLRELDPLPAFEGTPAGWDQFAQDWHEVKDLHLLGIPPAMHPQVLMRCLPAGLHKSVAGWVPEDPTMTLDKVFDRLCNDFQIADAHGNAHHWESLTLEAPGGKLTLAAWGTWKREWEQQRALVANSTPHQEYKLVMQALPRRYFDAVRTEEIRLWRRTLGTQFMGPEVTNADLEALMRARLGQNAQCLEKVLSFSNSF